MTSQRSSRLLIDAFDRVRDLVAENVAGLSIDQLAARLDDESNSITWLLWHLTRVQDDHVAELAGVEQMWTDEGWFDRFGLPFGAADTGYGQTGREVGVVCVDSPDLLTGYHDAVHAMTTRYLRGLSDADFDRIVDEAWDPPVTLATRLVSVVADDLQHAGQASFLRGVLLRQAEATGADD
ncbi:putative damage-inducible protein DinB [Actinoalloteichus hoggarensis]|uniref:mycothiol transferase n=1 Tax=Actinoalloteichus hoggarensis TaxID=1470176 RepID=UPI000B8B2E8A|nr:DUF664 domain-containing protein [Actinoalloteichus hoggarensis]MBB5920758.1 putative damage-inducible protein DinB [Actinoalloteichus hoggarensis]